MTLVVFDLGGVLVRIRHTWDAVLQEMGEPLPTGGVPMRHADYEALTAYQDGSMGEDAYLLQVGGDLGLTPERAREAHVSMLEFDYLGSADLVRDLRANGVRTACLSNTNAIHWTALTDPRRHPCLAELDRRFASFEIGVNKPLPGAFRRVSDAFPDADRRIFFDDNPGNVIAAINLGWEAHRVDPDGNPPQLMRSILVEKGVL